MSSLRQVVCWLDQWYGLTLDDIRKLEDDTQEALQRVSVVIVHLIMLSTLKMDEREKSRYCVIRLRFSLLYN